MPAHHPWIVPAVYVIMTGGLTLDITGFIDNSHLVFNYPVFLAAFLGGVKLIVNYLREKDVVLRKQVQWVVSGFVFFAIWSGFSVLLWTSGGTTTNEMFELLPTIAVPVCWAVALTRYRLMDIDDIFDHAVIFGVTIAALEAIELLVLGVLSPHVPFLGKCRGPKSPLGRPLQRLGRIMRETP